MILLNKRFRLVLIIIIVLLLIISYKRRKLFNTNIYSDGKICPVCKGKNLKIKKKYFFTSPYVRNINKKISSNGIRQGEYIMFGFPRILFSTYYYYGELIGYYLMMLFFPKKFKENKTFCTCKDCGKVSVVNKDITN